MFPINITLNLPLTRFTWRGLGQRGGAWERDWRWICGTGAWGLIMITRPRNVARGARVVVVDYVVRYGGGRLGATRAAWPLDLA